jgi:site-specific DNA-methyltransferase (adenine-specific)
MTFRYDQQALLRQQPPRPAGVDQGRVSRPDLSRPPFNSNASYNVLFASPAGEKSKAQIEAFDDTWHWNDSAELAFDEVLKGYHSDAAVMLRAMRSALGDNDLMAYLAIMVVRLIELHRVLKPNGSLYLHCDPTASHYLKQILDGIFGHGWGHRRICSKTYAKDSGFRAGLDFAIDG